MILKTHQEEKEGQKPPSFLGKTVTKDEEKPEVLNVFVASVVSNRASCHQGIQPLDLGEKRQGVE